MPRVCITAQGKNAQPYRFSLDRKVVRIGRSTDNDIVIDCPSVSSHHCEMKRIDGGYILEDKDSTNGIKVADARMEIIDLENGLDILVGDAALDFELTDKEKDALSEEEHVPKQRAPLPKKKKDGKASAKRPASPLPSLPGSPGAATPLVITPTTSGANFAITIGLLFVALMAFYCGLASKHQSKYSRPEYESTGLWGDMWDKGLPRKKP
ncbi:MAG: FHA domain-containing protein, partial [Verrucomicrobiota bacterium]|nr:FHA domain-containing protein [Verrucomicrobiota bacterium]